MPLQRDIVNPLESTTLTYSAGTEELITPWLDIGQDSDGLAKSVKIEVFTATATETVTLAYALNYSATYTSFTAITTSGVTEFLFPNSTAPTGTAFRSIRFRVRTVRGSTTTLRATFLPPTFLYRKKLPAKYGFTVEIDLSKDYKTTVRQMRDSLRTALESNPMVEFTYRSDTGTDFGASDRRYYVDVVEATNLEETGDNESGTSLVTMVEG